MLDKDQKPPIDRAAILVKARAAKAKHGGSKPLAEKAKDKETEHSSKIGGGVPDGTGVSDLTQSGLFSGHEAEIRDKALAAIGKGQAGVLSVAVRSLADAGKAVSQEDRDLLHGVRGLTLRALAIEAISVLRHEIDRDPKFKSRIIAELGLLGQAVKDARKKAPPH